MLSRFSKRSSVKLLQTVVDKVVDSMVGGRGSSPSRASIGSSTDSLDTERLNTDSVSINSTNNSASLNQETRNAGIIRQVLESKSKRARDSKGYIRVQTRFSN